jgi:hypothetical protein
MYLKKSGPESWRPSTPAAIRPPSCRSAGSSGRQGSGATANTGQWRGNQTSLGLAERWPYSWTAVSGTVVPASTCLEPTPNSGETRSRRTGVATVASPNPSGGEDGLFLESGSAPYGSQRRWHGSCERFGTPIDYHNGIQLAFSLIGSNSQSTPSN